MAKKTKKNITLFGTPNPKQAEFFYPKSGIRHMAERVAGEILGHAPEISDALRPLLPAAVPAFAPHLARIEGEPYTPVIG
jgi:hypothetical protein